MEMMMKYPNSDLLISIVNDKRPVVVLQVRIAVTAAAGCGICLVRQGARICRREEPIPVSHHITIQHHLEHSDEIQHVEHHNSGGQRIIATVNAYRSVQSCRRRRTVVELSHQPRFSFLASSPALRRRSLRSLLMFSHCFHYYGLTLLYIVRYSLCNSRPRNVLNANRTRNTTRVIVRFT